MNRIKKIGLAVGCASVTTLSAFAEGTTGTTPAVTEALLTPYIDSGLSAVVALLTAGAAIVGGFYIWGLIKKALNRSK